MRHGLTVGELAVFFVAHCGINLMLEIVPMQGWSRVHVLGRDRPSLGDALAQHADPGHGAVYPGGCLLEGTNLSEGRGTTRPFEIFGAPLRRSRPAGRPPDLASLPGCRFRPLHFEPTFHKFAGQVCGGVQVHVTDPEVFEAVTTYTAAIAAIRSLWPDDFAWKQPPYEYETEKLPIDILAGGILAGGARGGSVAVADEGILGGTAHGLRRSHRRVPPL